MKIIDRIVNLLDWINDVFDFLACGVLVFIVASVSAEVILRYFFNRPITWVLEVNENCLLYITFLVVAGILARDGHVKVEMVASRLNPNGQHLLALITTLLGLMMCLIVTWYGARITWLDFLSGSYKPTPNRIPEASVQFIIPVGTFLLSFQFLRQFCNSLRKWKLYRAQRAGVLNPKTHRG